MTLGNLVGCGQSKRNDGRKEDDKLALFDLRKFLGRGQPASGTAAFAYECWQVHVRLVGFVFDRGNSAH